MLLVSGRASPLTTILSGLYNLSIGKCPFGPQEYKAVVLDDQRNAPELANLKMFVHNGDELVIVSGTDSSSWEVLNSSFEDLLPVRWLPSTYKGGKVVVLVLDISMTCLRLGTRTGLRSGLCKSPGNRAAQISGLRDYKLGMVVFGTKASLSIALYHYPRVNLS